MDWIDPRVIRAQIEELDKALADAQRDYREAKSVETGERMKQLLLERHRLEVQYKKMRTGRRGRKLRSA